MGEVIKMFGTGGGADNSPFGQHRALGQVPAQQPNYSGHPEDRDSPPAAGAPAMTPELGEEIERGVALALEYARVATNRLVNLPPAGAVPRDVRKDLLDSYGSIEELARQIVDASRSSGSGMDLARETSRLQEDVQRYVDAVEAAIAPHAATASPAPALRAGSSRKLLLGAAAVAGVGIVGYAVWRATRG